MFTIRSFEKLMVISKHSVISQQIRSIYYEADTLDLVDRKRWEESIFCRSPCRDGYHLTLLKKSIEPSSESSPNGVSSRDTHIHTNN